jgi:hypothetical protein
VRRRGAHLAQVDWQSTAPVPERRELPVSKIARHVVAMLCALGLLAMSPAAAQRRAVPRHPAHPQPAVTLRGHVFIGGYFYDPVFGPYPWWHRTAYPYWYYPVFDNRAEVRLTVAPKGAEDAAVYVDGFYAGVVDDFNGVFQALPLPPGGHTITLFLEGYRTVRRNIYLSPGSTFRLRETMLTLAAGETSESPEVSPPVPPPPAGSYRPPVTPNRAAGAATARATPGAGFGTLDIFVQPAGAQVTLDGQRWQSTDEGHFVVQVPAGTHRVEVTKSGYRRFETDIDVREGQSSPLNVSLMAGSKDEPQ